MAYSCLDAGLLRVAAAPPAPTARGWPDPTRDEVADLVGWLRAVRTLGGFVDAVELASPVLTAQIDRLRGHPDPSRRDAQRAVRATVRYLLRASTRATPFGLFAGVAPLHLAATTTARFGSDDRVVARPDATWLADALHTLQRSRPLVRRLPVALTDLAVVRDGRLVVPAATTTGRATARVDATSLATTGAAEDSPRHAVAGRTTPDSWRTQEVSVRRTPAVAAVMDLARRPVVFTRLASALGERFPATPAEAVDAMLFELVDHDVLLTALHSPMTVTDPLTHLIDIATAAGADEVDDVAPLLAALRSARTHLDEHDRARSASRRRELRSRAANELRAVSASDRPIDLRVDADVALPATVAREAERAAAVMAQLAAPPSADTPWADYHRRFLDRYGPGARVPVATLLHGGDELGYPAGYRDSTLPHPTRRTAVGRTAVGRDPAAESREATLLELAHRAAWEHRREIELTDAELSLLGGDTRGEVDASAVRPHVEIRAEVHATTRTSLDRGEFTLAVLSVSRAAGTLTGRFLDLLDPQDQARMRAVLAGLPTLTEDAVPAQLSCPPVAVSATTITRTPPVLARQIALGQPHVGAHPADHTNPDLDLDLDLDLDDRDADPDHADPGRDAGPIRLDDLAVSADSRGLYLVSLSRGRPVEPHLFGAIELVRAAHPTLRFLAEITTATARTLAPFAWGPARRLPFLPRVRHGRTILTPARWRLRPTDLTDYDDVLQRWRRRWAVPDTVLLGGDDRRLRLDLTEPAHHDVLRDHLHRAGHATVLEAPAANAFGWLDHRPHEIVLTLASTVAGQPGRPRPTGAPRCRRGPVDRPGAGRWLSARLHGRPDHLTHVLIHHLRDLLSRLATATAAGPGAWFLRHTDPDPHLRLRLPLPTPEAFGPAARTIAAWAGHLADAELLGRLEFDTYRAETGRFGAGAVLDAAHAAFAADSTAALAQLQLAAHNRSTGLTDGAITAAGILDLVAAFATDPAVGGHWLLDHAPRTVTHGAGNEGAARSDRTATLTLTGPDGTAHLTALPGGAAVLAAWQHRADALTAYRDALHTGGVDDPTVVLADLLHLHHARTLGLSLASERRCLWLARAAALSRLHRARTTP